MKVTTKQTPKRRRSRARHRPEPQDRDVLNAGGAAKLLGVSSRLVLRLAREGKLPGKKVGREWRFSRGLILRWLAEPEGQESLPTNLEELLKDPRVQVRARRA